MPKTIKGKGTVCRANGIGGARGAAPGFTLIEVLVVVTILAVGLALSASLTTGTYRVQVKKEMMHLMSVIRYAYNDSVTKHLYNRIVFDFEKQSYWLESSTDPFYLQSDAEKEEESKKVKNRTKIVDDEEEEVEAPPIGEGSFAEATEGDVKRTVLNGEVRLKTAMVQHQSEPVSEGQAYLYFFPNGMTEVALFHFTDEDDAQPYSFVVEPLTGNVKISSGLMEYEELVKK